MSAPWPLALSPLTGWPSLQGPSRKFEFSRGRSPLWYYRPRASPPRIRTGYFFSTLLEAQGAAHWSSLSKNLPWIASLFFSFRLMHFFAAEFSPLPEERTFSFRELHIFHSGELEFPLWASQTQICQGPAGTGPIRELHIFHSGELEFPLWASQTQNLP